MKNAKLLLTGLLLTGFTGAFAQETNQAQQNNQWSLRECVEYAYTNNITIKQSELQFSSDRAELFQSKAALLPTINAGASYSFNSGRTLDPTTQQFETNKVQTSNVNVQGSLLLFQGGQLRKSIKQFQSTAQSSQLALEQSKNDVALTVALNYLQVLSNQELVAIAQNQVAQSELQTTRTGKLVEAGSLPQTNLLDLQSQLAIDKASFVTAQNNLNFAKLTLMQSMNLPAQSEFEVERLEIEEPTIAAYEKSVQEVYEIAERTLPSVQSADFAVKSAEYSVQATRGLLYPSISLIGGLSTNYSDQSLLYNDLTGPVTGEIIGYVRGNNQTPVFREIIQTVIQENNYPYFRQLGDNLSNFFGARLNIPIVNGWQTRTQISRSVIQRKNAQLTAQSTRVTLRQNIEQAYNNLLAAAATYNSFKDQVAALELSFRATESRFNVGLVNSVDYNLAKVNLDQARANLINAKYDYTFRIKILDFYQNKPLSF